MRWIHFSVVALLFLSAPEPANARGGGGCLVEGTQVLTPKGSVAIEKLKADDQVLSVESGKLYRARVQALEVVRPEEYLEISAGDSRVTMTPEHPVMTAPGEFRQANLLKKGDTVYRVHRGAITTVTVRSIKRLPAWRPAYNLLVSPGGTFVTEGIIVHNKGCFLPDTPILKADGTEAPISALRPGDSVMAFTHDGRLVTASVKKTLSRDVPEYVELRTDRRILRVTPDHPFYVGNGTFRTLETLQPGDTILSRDGRSLAKQQILSLHRIRERITVYNLRTETPNTFFAAGLAVHNKGGGGGSHGGGFSSSSRYHSGGGSSGSSGSPDGAIVAIVFLIIILIVVFKIAKYRRSSSKSENLDFVYDRSQINRKAVKTEKLVEFLSRQDPAVSPQELRTLTETVFRKLQQCWSARDYLPMAPLLMPDLHALHSAQLRGLARNHEVNIIDTLTVEGIDLVNVRYTEKPNQREFTALVTASARDYYTDDRTGSFLRGDSAPARFQEFWTFQRAGDGWLLREIEQTGESDFLKDENFVEMLTAETVQRIYDEAAREGTAGPWLEKEEETKASRTERLLNFLVQTDKLWERRRMLERARQVFLRVYLAREADDPAGVPTVDLFPDIDRDLRTQMIQWRTDGITVEYRNLCVRKVEIVLVRNFAVQANDEFTVRIDAHAQRIIRKGGVTLQEDRYVSPFEEYWTFGRLDGEWKLKEVLPPAVGKRRSGEENLDEDSSAGQMEWYYRQPRAN